jgi:hypothetical protein
MDCHDYTSHRPGEAGGSQGPVVAGTFHVPRLTGTSQAAGTSAGVSELTKTPNPRVTTRPTDPHEPYPSDTTVDGDPSTTSSP